MNEGNVDFKVNVVLETAIMKKIICKRKIQHVSDDGTQQLGKEQRAQIFKGHQEAIIEKINNVCRSIDI